MSKSFLDFNNLPNKTNVDQGSCKRMEYRMTGRKN